MVPGYQPVSRHPASTATTLYYGDTSKPLRESPFFQWRLILKQGIFNAYGLIRPGTICTFAPVLKTVNNIRTLTLAELEEYFQNIGEKKFRAKQVYEWLWLKQAHSFDAMTNLSKELRAKLN